VGDRSVWFCAYQKFRLFTSKRYCYLTTSERLCYYVPVNEIVRVVEQLAEFETSDAKLRKRTLIVRSSAELVEQLRALPEPWLIKSITRQQKRFMVRLVRLEL
jgi:hypothetical protein